MGSDFLLERFNFRNWSSLSAYAFSLHTQVTGDNALRMQVKKILRNLCVCSSRTARLPALICIRIR